MPALQVFWCVVNYKMGTKTNKFLKIILSVLVILLPYIYSNGAITGDKFLSPMYEVFYISKITCTIVGICMINREI